VLKKYIYFVSEINKSTNKVQIVHTIYTQAEPIPTLAETEIQEITKINLIYKVPAKCSPYCTIPTFVARS
jgi:hypothetical protein